MPNSMASLVLREIHDAWRRQDLDRLASYLPDDFSHQILLPAAITSLGGLCEGKSAALERLRTIAETFEIIKFDTSQILVEADRAAVRIPICYWHRLTGTTLETTIGCFWELEEGWPVRIVEYHDVERLKRFFETVQEAA